MPPSVRSYLVADNSPDKGVQASVASNQLVTVVAARMKKAVAGVVHETMHRIGAVNRVEREITQARHAIWKCHQDFADCHVIVGKSLNQRHGAVFFSQAKLTNRYKIASGPCAGNCAISHGETTYSDDGRS